MVTYQVYDIRTNEYYAMPAITAQEAVRKVWLIGRENTEAPNVIHRYGVVLCGEFATVTNMPQLAKEAALELAKEAARKASAFGPAMMVLKHHGIEATMVANSAFSAGYSEPLRQLTYLHISPDPYEPTLCYDVKEQQWLVDSPGDWGERVRSEHCEETGDWQCACDAWNGLAARQDDYGFCETCGARNWLA